MAMTRLRMWFAKIILNYIVRQAMKLLEDVAYRVAEYFDALTVDLQERNRKASVAKLDPVREVAKVAAAVL